MQNFNYHTHTYRCGHADCSISDEEYVRLFIKNGFKKICFTDHCPQRNKVDFRSNMRMGYRDKEEYYQSIRCLKEKYKDEIDIEVGFEVEYVPCLEEELFLLKNETDKLILGQHFVCEDNGENIRIIGWGITNESDILRYAEFVKRAIEKGLIDIVAHPDLFMFRKDSFSKTEETATHIICEAAQKYGVPLEINLTRACLYLYNKTDEIEYPSKEFWKIASTYDIKVIYGVDAHFREQINSYQDSIDIVKKHLGNDIVNKLNFVNESLK